MIIKLKSPEEIALMDEANRIVHKILDLAEKSIAPWETTTKSLNDIMAEELEKYDAVPAFKGYRGFPEVACISVNEEVVHGIPSDRIIKDGDIVGVDFGVSHKGYYGDAARTFIVGPVKPEVEKLVADTKNALYRGIEQMVAGNMLGDVCRAIEQVAKDNGYGVVKGMGGHGIGSDGLHLDPFIPNYVSYGFKDLKLRNGMVFAIEPMFCLGSGAVELLNDKWTVKTKDNNISAHWELSAAITENGTKILGVSNG